MIKVVIVEDEMLVRMGLKSCLESDEKLIVTGTFTTAEDAEKYLRKENADVMITDIRLPGITGLELIRRVKQFQQDLLVIVLSCYEDFNYARTALQYGAARYLLKHELNEEELPDMVKSLFGNQKNQPKPNEPGITPEDVLRTVCTDGARIMSFCFRGTEESTNATVQEINLDMLAEIIDSVLQNYSIGRCFTWRDGTVFAICNFEENDIQRGYICFREISDKMTLYLNKNCYAGVSDVFYSKEDFQFRLQQAIKRSRLSFFYEKSMLFSENAQEENVCPNLVFEKIDAFTDNWNISNKHQIDTFFVSCGRLKPNINQIKESVMRYVYSLLEHGEQYYNLDTNKAYKADMAPSYQLINQYDSLVALRHWLLEIVEQTIRYVQSQNNLASNICEYLKQHYSDADMLQSEVAGVFHMSSSYFSQYFKEKFGVNYVHYLNMLRIEQAKLLLRTTKESTETIAERVGIPNSNYFFRLFKKLEGCTVKMYKKRMNADMN